MAARIDANKDGVSNQKDFQTNEKYASPITRTTRMTTTTSRNTMAKTSMIRATTPRAHRMTSTSRKTAYTPISYAMSSKWRRIS